MPYTKFHEAWENDPSTNTPITAAALDHIEEGIQDAQDAADAATADAILKATINAKGDIIAGSGDNLPGILSVSADGMVLTADAAQPLGVKWATPAGGSATATFPIDLMTPISSSSGGNVFWTVAALTGYDFGHWEFVKDVGGKVFGLVQVPAGLSGTGGNIILNIAANATTGVTRLSVASKAVADAESINPTLTSETAQDITVPGTAYLRKKVTFALTEALAAGDVLIVSVYHEGAHANDTLAVNTLLINAYLEVLVT